MARSSLFRLTGIVLLALGASALSAQGLYYESVLKGGPMGDKEMASKTYLMPRMFKHVSGEDNSYMIIRMDEEKLYSVEVDKKEYSVMTFAEMEQAMKKMDSQMAAMEDQMKDMPEEQRKMIEQMMGGKKSKTNATPVEMVKTGETKTMLGYSCYRCVAREGDKELMTLWVTKGVRGFDKLRKDYEALTRRMMSMNPSFMKGLADAMMKIDGFPLEMTWGEMTTLVTKVESRTSPSSEFVVPAGFTKVDSPLMKME